MKLHLLLSLSGLVAASAVACTPGSTDGNGGAGAGSNDDTTSNGANGSVGSFMASGGGGSGGGSSGADPTTCEQAATAKTYLGCEFYPTVMANNVWSVFDFAAVVANGQAVDATVTVTGYGQNQTVTVPANSATTVYLPWVPALKGPDFDACTAATPLAATVRVPDGAYQLISSVPVTVYQFNALEYGTQGGPPGKDWSSCPAQQCGLACFSYSNDASLLLPATALTGNYRIFGYPGWQAANIGPTVGITGTQDNTTVTVTLAALGQIIGGGGVQTTQGPNGITSFTLQKGEVVQLVGTANSDFSGSLVQADKPIQVISGLPCRNIPDNVAACDHIEESVFPAETLGERYVIPTPTGPNGTAVSHTIRFYGNVDGTTLTYAGTPPPGAPTTLQAFQVWEAQQVTGSFEVTGSNAFAVSTFIQGAQLINPQGETGDPAHSIVTAAEQYRYKYVFLAPTDYDVNYVDVVMPPGTALTLDGAAVTPTTEPISADYVIARVSLPDVSGGSHVLTGDQAFGIQVVGYGSYTSYMYPGGLNLELIAPPPPPPQ